MDKMTKMIDLVIPAAPKDYSKLPIIVRQARMHVAEITDVHIIAPTSENIPDIASKVYLHHDSEVLPYIRTELSYRPSWVFQQYLKIFQNVTKRDWFLVIDADTFINHDLPMFTENEKPILYLGRDQYRDSYFNFNKKILKYGKVHTWSFLSECTLYNKVLVQVMLHDHGFTLDSFWHKTVDIASEDCCPADSELYGSYVYKEHPDLYELRHLNATLGGRYGSHIWTEQEIWDEVAAQQINEPDIISLHSWEGTV